jgi:hypothetical protein
MFGVGAGITAALLRVLASGEAEGNGAGGHEAGRARMVTTTFDSVTVNADSGGRPETTLTAHPGWFHRCRRTGQLQWVPAALERESGQTSSSAGGPGTSDQISEAQPALSSIR